MCQCTCASLRAEVEALRKENARLVAECATLKAGWTEFERVGLHQVERLAAARRWARAWRRAAREQRSMVRVLRAQIHWMLDGGLNVLANNDRRG